MSKFSRVIVLVVGLMSVFAAMAGAANASTWTNSGNTAFTATTGPGTLTGGSATLTCSGATATGTAGTSSAGPSWIGAVSGTVNYTGCRIGGVPAGVRCSFTLDALTFSGSTTTGNVNVNCTVTGTTCTITGQIRNGSYVNPTASTTGRLTIPASTSLVLGGTNCILGSGASSLTAQTFNLTNGVGGTAGFRYGPVISQP